MANFALFVDFENILYEVAKRDELVGTENLDGAPSAEASDLTLQLLTRLVARFERGDEHNILVRRAYADWEALGATGNQTALQLMSIKPEPVLAKPGKNSADLELSLDAQEVLLTRTDIGGIIIVSGDRDYIPIVRRLKERGKQVYVVGMGQASSGDLRAIVGPRNFLHGENFLRQPRYDSNRTPERTSERTESPAPRYEPLRPGHYGTHDDSLTLAPLTGDESDNGAEPEADERQPAGLSNDSYAGRGRESRMDEFDDDRQPEELALSEDELRQHLNDYNVRKCIRLVHEAVSQHSNHIYLVPFFRNYMNLKFTYLANDQRKELLKKLQQDDVIQMEWTPTSQPNGGYTSFSLNYDNPLVRETLGPDAAPPSNRPRSSAPRDTGARYADPRTAYGSAY